MRPSSERAGASISRLKSMTPPSSPPVMNGVTLTSGPKPRMTTCGCSGSALPGVTTTCADVPPSTSTCPVPMNTLVVPSLCCVAFDLHEPGQLLEQPVALIEQLGRRRRGRSPCRPR